MQPQSTIPVVLATTTDRQLEEITRGSSAPQSLRWLGLSPELTTLTRRETSLFAWKRGMPLRARSFATLLMSPEFCPLVKTRVIDPHMEFSGLIKGVPPPFTDERLVRLLSDQGVVHARRLFSRSEESGTMASPRLVVTFPATHARLKVLDLGFTKHRVLDYVEPPRRCFNCQLFGHVSSRCRG